MGIHTFTFHPSDTHVHSNGMYEHTFGIYSRLQLPPGKNIVLRRVQTVFSHPDHGYYDAAFSLNCTSSMNIDHETQVYSVPNSAPVPTLYKGVVPLYWNGRDADTCLDYQLDLGVVPHSENILSSITIKSKVHAAADEKLYQHTIGGNGQAAPGYAAIDAESTSRPIFITLTFETADEGRQHGVE